MITRLLRTVVLSAGLAFLIALLIAAGRIDVMSAPTSDLGTWLGDPPAVAAFGIRCAGLGFAVYILVLVVLVGAQGPLPSTTVTTAPRWLIHLIAGLLGVSAAVLPQLVDGDLSDAPDQLTLTLLPTDRPVLSETSNLPRLVEVQPSSTPRTAHPYQSMENIRSMPNVDRDDVWAAEPGDSFWSIAEETLHDAGFEAPSEAQIAQYWRLLIEENRDRLVDPLNPDLILPGQVFLLPTI